MTLYGQFDAGVYSLKNIAATDKTGTVYGDGATFSNVLGFKGIEDIGGGLSAGFDFQTDVQTNNGGSNAAGMFRRQANGNIASKTLGELKLGLTTNPIIATNGALMPAGAAGNSVATAASAAIGYADFYTKNAVTYTSPSVMGVVAQIQKGLSNDTENSSNGSMSAYSLAYVNGPLEARYAAQDRKQATDAIGATAPNGSATAANSFNKKSSIFGLKYTMGAWSAGVARLSSEGQLGYTYNGVTKNTSGSVAKRTGNQVGVSYTNGAMTYGYARTNAEGSSLSTVQARYALSKRTNLIGTYGVADNKGTLVGFNPLSFNTGTSPSTIINSTATPTTGEKQSGFGVALTHSF